jgi:hypothetical protein
MADFKAGNETNLGNHRSHDLYESEDNTSEIIKIVCKASDYFTEVLMRSPVSVSMV